MPSRDVSQPDVSLVSIKIRLGIARTTCLNVVLLEKGQDTLIVLEGDLL